MYFIIELRRKHLITGCETKQKFIELNKRNVLGTVKIFENKINEKCSQTNFQFKRLQCVI